MVRASVTGPAVPRARICAELCVTIRPGLLGWLHPSPRKGNDSPLTTSTEHTQGATRPYYRAATELQARKLAASTQIRGFYIIAVIQLHGFLTCLEPPETLSEPVSTIVLFPWLIATLMGLIVARPGATLTQPSLYRASLPVVFSSDTCLSYMMNDDYGFAFLTL